MATAVEHGSEPRTPTPPALSLPVLSLLGAIYVVVSVAVVLYGVPGLWKALFGDRILLTDWFDAFLEIALQVVLAVVFLLAGRQFLGASPKKGVRGGIFLVMATTALVFFIWRWVALSVSGNVGLGVSLAVAAGLTILAVRLLGGASGAAWMVAVEEQGWFHASAYKRILGQRVRRLTILGIVLLGGTGCYSLWVGGSLPETWTLSMPFNVEPLHIVSAANVAIPWVLFAFTVWLAYRAVNVPSFAEFLIATEAEMNKVSWTPRRRLGQDTVVVLTTTLLLSLFLLVVDIFWGSLLSWKYIGVLPAKATTPEKVGNVQQARW